MLEILGEIQGFFSLAISFNIRFPMATTETGTEIQVLYEHKLFIRTSNHAQVIHTYEIKN
jgi:hypothetical protein